MSAADRADLLPGGAAHEEGGSVLVLMPAAVFVLLVLSAIAVDFAVMFLGEREVADAAAAAANDAASALNEQRFYACGEVLLDQATAETVANEAVAARTSDSVATSEVGVDTGRTDAGVPEVSVTVTGTVELVFASAIPGASRTAEVSATSVATAEQDPGIAPIEVTCP